MIRPNLDAWVRILYTYGPFAILVFLVFVTERKFWGSCQMTQLHRRESPKDTESAYVKTKAAERVPEGVSNMVQARIVCGHPF